MPFYSFYSIGFDDIDSLLGGCTTHFATLVIRKIYRYGGFLLDYPRLIRLNPDIPWKTRGNGAVAIDFGLRKDLIHDFIEDIKKDLVAYVTEEGASPGSTQPGMLVIDVKKMDPEKLDILMSYSMKATYQVIDNSILKETISKISDSIISMLTINGRRGLIGSLAAIGNLLLYDYTYELLVYRSLGEKGRRFTKKTLTKLKDILIDIEDEFSFAHVDYENNKVLVTPAGPDPVIMGIRGDSPSKLYSIFRRLVKDLSLKYESWILYVTNQGTNEHLYNSKQSINQLYYRQILRNIEIKGSIKDEMGSHKYMNNFQLSGQKGRLYVYYESGRMRNFFSSFEKGDLIEIGGSIKPSIKPGYDVVVNSEYISILKLNNTREVKPVCPKCYTHMVSMGRDKGYRCRKCGYRIEWDNIYVNIYRSPYPDILLPPLRSIKHLSKPLKRFGREKRYRIRGLRNIKYIWLNDV